MKFNLFPERWRFSFTCMSYFVPGTREKTLLAWEELHPDRDKIWSKRALMTQFNTTTQLEWKKYCLRFFDLDFSLPLRIVDATCKQSMWSGNRRSSWWDHIFRLGSFPEWHFISVLSIRKKLFWDEFFPRQKCVNSNKYIQLGSCDKHSTDTVRIWMSMCGTWAIK